MVVLVWQLLPHRDAGTAQSDLLTHARLMWLTLSSNSTAPDLVLDATLRTLPLSSAVFVLCSVLAALLALGLTVRNALILRAQGRRQERDLSALRTRERRLRLSVQDSEDGLVHLEPVRNAQGRTVDFQVTDANRRAATLFRRTESEVRSMMTSMLPSLAPDTPLFRDLVATMERGTVYRAEVRANPRMVATSWLSIRAVAVDGGLALTLSDIRERKREANRLRRASMTDELTSLMNRRAFLETAEVRLRDARAHHQDALLFYLDCDAFKQINDVHGHLTGDRALREIARALRGAVRETDVVARMGGDEFTILAVDAVGDCAATIRSRIDDRIEALNRQELLPAPLSVSVGHVYVPASSERSLEDLLETADRELLTIKRARREAREPMADIAHAVRAPKSRATSARAKAARAGATVQLTGVGSAA